MHGNLPALPLTVSRIIEEYDSKVESLPGAFEEFKEAVSNVEMAASIQGKYSHYDIFGRSGKPNIDERQARKSLLVSGWLAIYDRLQIDRIATANDRKLFKQAMSDPVELTRDNVRATFEKYLLDPRHHILRGLAECFVKLDPAYKSHSKVKIGVNGLPKRIIVEYMRGSGSHGFDTLRDILNCLATFRGEALTEHAEFREIERMTSTLYPNKPGTVHIRGLEIRVFKNGNAHVIFSKNTLLDINRALAEFYGEVLPDAEEENAKKQPGTAVSKDLQYYPTPSAVVGTALDSVSIYSNDTRPRFDGDPVFRVLEPSCGCGRFMDEIRRRGHKVFGFEVNADRAAEAKAKGHNVLVVNFLETAPNPVFDRVVMNPPFYGKHYAKHVRHAMKFLKPGGKLVAVLPATAHYDHTELDDLKPSWTDLPVASFAESGTNVPTGIAVIYKPEVRA